MTIEQQSVEANGVTFSYFAAGSGPLALCLHGFPDSAHTWRHLLPRLADAGYRAVAPFMRGYAPTSVPADGRYQTAVLSADANALHDVLGGDGDAVIIGHDWGAPATYGAVIAEPDRWRRAVGMAVPPGPGVAEALITYEQLARSWYMFFFLNPLADFVVAHDDLAFVDGLWADWSPDFDSTSHRELVKPSLREPENLAAAIGYYRATLGGIGQDPALAALQASMSSPVPTPLLYLHGDDEGCITNAVDARAPEGFGHPDSQSVLIPGTGHFVHLEQPEVVNDLVVRHVTA